MKVKAFLLISLLLIFFTTGLINSSAAQSITLVTPNGGEVWEANSNQTITWTGTGISGSIYLEYSLDGGTSWNYLYWGWGDNTGGSHSWDIPFIASTNVKIKATFWDNQSVTDQSDNVFTIAMPLFSIVAPNGNETYYASQTYNIQWIASNSTTLTLEYSTDNAATWQTISNNVPAATGTYAWTVPATPSYNCLVKATDNDNASLKDSSNYNFTIAPLPTLQMVYPNGGESLEVGETYNIAWSGTDLNGGVVLEFSEDNGTNWSYIAYSSSNSTGGTYSWTVPSILTSTALIRVKYNDVHTVNDVSNAYFSIVMPSFALLHPTGNETFFENQVIDILFVAANSTSVSLHFSSDGGFNWLPISTNIPATAGSYSWTVPNVSSNLCLVKLSDNDMPTEVDSCQNFFNIKPLPTLLLSAPNGGETLTSGDTYSITWSGSDIQGNIFIEYSFNAGANWSYIGWGYGTSSGGSFDWIVPANYSTTCLIRVTFWDYQAVKDSSNAYFSIAQPSFMLNAPNGGENLFPGNNFTIDWIALNSQTIEIDFSDNNGLNWQNIATQVNAQQAPYNWTVPNMPSQSCLIKITDSDTPSLTDQSNSSFNINAIPTIQLVSPNGGEDFQVGDTCTIYWNGSGLNGGIFIEASYDNGNNWYYIAWVWGTLTNGSHQWIIPNNITTQAKVRVKLWDYPSAIDESDAVFSISPPDFAIIAPGGGQMFYPSSQATIQWYAASISQLDIAYSSDNGNTWQTVANQADASLGSYIWTVPNTPSTACLIRLSESGNSSNSVVSSLFTIKILPVLTIISPNGGELIDAGDTYEIIWGGTDIDNGINIEYSSDGGMNWNYINSAQGSPTGGNFFWQVPFISSNTVLLRIILWSAPFVSDTSNNTFSIVMPDFVLIQPNGGEQLYPMQQYQINWTAQNAAYVKIEYSHDNGIMWQTVADSVIASLGTYAWIVPNTTSAQCLVRIKDIDNPTDTDISDAIFSILQMPTIELQTPNGGEQFTAGQSVTIEWTGVNIEGNIYIEYSKNGGASWEYLSWAWGSVNGGTYNWVIPFFVSNQVLVRAKFWQVQSVYDQSNAVFSVALPSFVLIKPNGNETLYPGNTFTIEWNAANSTFIKAEYTYDDGLNWLPIADSLPAAGNAYAWTIPNTPSNTCRVRLTDMDNPLTFDVSNAVFTIYPIPTLTLLTPNGGETMTAGTLFDITWSGTNINSSLYLEYSLNGGSTWQYLGWAWGNTNGGSFSWQVPFYQSQNVRVRAKLWDFQSVSDMSDASFTINLPPFALVTPNGGYNYYPGNQVNVQWIALNSTAIHINYSVNNGQTWLPVASNVNATTGNYNWIIPNTPSNFCILKITDVNDSTVVDVSDNVFTIKVLPSIDLLQPTGGEVWTAGDTTLIIWSGTNLDGNVIIEFSTNNWLTAGYAGGVYGWTTGGSYPISVPFIQTSTAQIRVRMLEAPTVTDVTNSLFSIVYPPFSVIAPNGLEELYPTNVAKIKWYAAGATNIRIDFSTDNGTTWTNIEQSINATTGVYDWVVPNTPSANCLIKITDVNNPTVWDVSNSVFTIKTLPTINLTSPVGGEELISGTWHNITYTGTNLENAVRIYYSVDMGYSWQFIYEVWSMPTGASYQWFVPYTASHNALVKVYMYEAPGVVSQSNAVFTIKHPDLGLITPNGNSTYFPLYELKIKWVCSNASHLNLDYTIDNGSTWAPIAQQIPSGFGEYNWIIPNTPSNFCKVRITDASNPGNTDMSDTVFRIQDLPVLEMVSPNGGEIISAGTQFPVFWSGSGLTEPVIIEYTTDNWATSQMINWKEGNEDGDSLLWAVPFVPTTQASMRAYYYYAPSVNDESDNNFSIVNPPFALMSPQGGQSYFPTNEVYIQWIADNTTALKIEYSTDNGNTWMIIANNVNASMGFYAWLVPNTPSAYCKIKISDQFNPLNTSQSLNTFTIHPYPTLQVLAPNGGEQLIAGNTYPIIWEGTDLNGAVRLEYSTDGGLTWNFIENLYDMSYGGTYYWLVPFQITNQALVRVSFLPVTLVSDDSDNFFSIVNPTFALVSPNNAGLNFYPNSTLYVQWLATGTAYIKILFSSDNGQTWTLVADSVNANTGIYGLTLPNTPSTTCRIRIVDVNNNLIYDTSDNPFTIQMYPALTLLQPNGGEMFVEGDTILIQWSGQYLTGGLYIDYSIDTGATWVNIASKWGNPNGDKYKWVAPHIHARVLVKLTYMDIPELKDSSDGLFDICFQPELYLTLPPMVCQPYTLDLSNHFADSAAAPGTVTYWLDNAAQQPLLNPTQIDATGTYYVLKETFFGTCSHMLPIDVNVGSTPSAPVVQATISICSADTLVLLQASGQNIVWYANPSLTLPYDTGNTINAAVFTTDTTLYLTQHVIPSCPSDVAIVQIDHNITPPAPLVTPPPPWCAGDSIAPITVNGANVEWYADSTLQTLIQQGNTLLLPILVNDTIFFVTQTDNNCISMPSLLQLTVYPTPPKPAIMLSGNSLVSSSTYGNMWYNTQGVFLDTNQYFTPPADGFYYVIVTINGCISDTSDVVYYYITGNEATTANPDAPIVYPNPFSEGFNLILPVSTETMFKLSIYTTTGALVHEEIRYYDHGSTPIQVATGTLPPGVYFLKAESSETVYRVRIISY